MDLSNDPAFEMRTDPTTGRKVLIAEARAGRPKDFVDQPKSDSHAAEHCPFCRGHESHTPHELVVVCDSQGEWQIRVVPNKFPAVASNQNLLPCREGLSTAGTELPLLKAPPRSTGEGDLFFSDHPHGIHEVFIESPRHVVDWAELSTTEVAAILEVFQKRIEHAYTAHGMESAMLFKNVGPAAGASLEHIHSQLIALPYIPDVLECELAIAHDFYTRQGKCLMCDLLSSELACRERVVFEDDRFAAICAFAGRQPYETWIVPKQHASDFTKLTAQESRGLAEMLCEIIRTLRDVVNPATYNLLLHTAPTVDDRGVAFHWHWELIPRTTPLAGFEWGAGMHINSVSPERAAIRLRSSKTGEKVPIQ